MFIQTEATPNPNTMKFIPGKDVMAESTASFSDAEAAKASPLAEALFAIEGVGGVFFGSDFISVTKQEAGEWSILKPLVLTTVMDHYVSGKPIMYNDQVEQAAVASSQHPVNEEDAEIVAQIKELIETRVRPAVAEDGGDIIFQAFAEGTVFLELHGACSGCPSSTITLKDGIENMLRHYIPEVERVEATNAELDY